MRFRKVLFWSHLVVGLAVGVIVFVLAATGVLLTYEAQVLRWAELGSVGDPGAPGLDADALAGAALRETGGTAEALVFENHPGAPVAVRLAAGERLLLDPATGAVVEAGGRRLVRFFDAVTGVHRWLTPGGYSGAGRAVTGVANLGFLFLALTGAYLWLPRMWKWARIKYLVLFRRRYPSGQARDYHWHHIFAFWAFIPLVLVISTGVTMSYDRVQGVAMTLAGVGAEDTSAAETPMPAQRVTEAARLETLLASARDHAPDWTRITLDLPGSADAATVTAMVDTGAGRRPTRQEVLVLDRADGRVIGVETFADRPKAVRTFQFLRFAHTGEYYGIVGQTVAGLASLASLFMVYTGCALAWRRLVAPALRRRRRR